MKHNPDTRTEGNVMSILFLWLVMLPQNIYIIYYLASLHCREDLQNPIASLRRSQKLRLSVVSGTPAKKTLEISRCRRVVGRDGSIINFIIELDNKLSGVISRYSDNIPDASRRATYHS
jgi:hypothetical protein